MKTPKDPRHLERIEIMQQLFAWSFNGKKPPDNEKARSIVKKIRQIDKLTEQAAPTWPIAKINKIDLAILRLAIFELVFEKNVPPKVAVDEAVELAKSYGSDSSPGFINGALGKLISDLKIEA